MKKIIIIGVVIVLIVVGAFFFTRGTGEQQVSNLDVTDTVRGFYDGWLGAVKDPAVEPNQKTLAKSPILSKELRSKLATILKDSEATTDPVLCQSVIPEEFSTRTVFESESEAQILVTSKDKKVTEQAIFSLLKYNEGWYINGIECSLGEFAPKREFTFENVGNLLKGSIPPPYDPKVWHLVYKENNQPGHVVPILFDAESQCKDLSGGQSVCKPSELKEVTKVLIRGQMTERGVDVDQLEFVK